MLGLTLDKLLLITILAGALIGPSRLPVYTRQLAGLVRNFRQFLEATRATAQQDLNLTAEEWKALDLRRYDPRVAVREAFARPEQATQPRPATGGAAEGPTKGTVEEPVDPRVEHAAGVRPGQRYLVSGPASHPRRILIASLPEDDPRRIAAEREPESQPEAEIESETDRAAATVAG